MKCIKVKSFILKHQYQMWKNICRATPHHCQSEIVYCCDIRQLVWGWQTEWHTAMCEAGRSDTRQCLADSLFEGKLPGWQTLPIDPTSASLNPRIGEEGVRGVTTQQYTPVHQPSLFCFPQTAGAVLQHQIFPTHIGISISYISEKLGNWSVGHTGSGQSGAQRNSVYLTSSLQ